MEGKSKKTIILVGALLVVLVAIAAYFIVGIQRCNDIKQVLIGKTFSGIASTKENYKHIDADTFYLVVEFLDEDICNVEYVYYENEYGIDHKTYSGNKKYEKLPYSLSSGFGGVKFELQNPLLYANESFKVIEENGEIKITTDDFKNGLSLTMEEGLAWE